VWPNNTCRIVLSSGLVDLLKVCTSNEQYVVKLTFVVFVASNHFGDIFNNSFCSTSLSVYEGKATNHSTCDTCSGLGTCSYQVCTCDAPTTSGIFAGIQMVTGADCSQIRHQYTVTVSFGVVIIRLYASNILVNIVTSRCEWIYVLPMCCDINRCHRLFHLLLCISHTALGLRSYSYVILLMFLLLFAESSRSFCYSTINSNVLACVIGGCHHGRRYDDDPQQMLRLDPTLICLCWYIVASMMSLPTPTIGLCVASQWLTNIGFDLVFFSLICKTYRLYRIFANKRLQVVTFKNEHLYIMLSILIVIEVILLAISSGVSPMSIVAQATSVDAHWEYVIACNSPYRYSSPRYCTAMVVLATHCGFAWPNRNTFSAIDIAYKALLVVYGVFLAFEIKDIDRNYNESKFLAIVIYNLAITCVVAGPLVIFLGEGTGSPASQAIFVIAYVCCFAPYYRRLLPHCFVCLYCYMSTSIVPIMCYW
jgi:hypothetical protein